ncbi:Tol-Pal system protein TolB [Alkalicaulis satelles]|uniref:Tol-Pal system protein TolB n=1 Tax=Alkalicaulis satelles TaxID=2609175 RepID=A0A5M6ZGS7_9PROT|nr:Tol-Pal system beta propeller repeat protein TolB [Alkalicaulis satelles]KAA5802348.1 Tol-Pal system protein TolB [Alkalicaulis satelles]
MISFSFSRLAAGLAALVLLTLPAHAQGPLRVDVTEGHLDPMPVAIPDFIGADGRAAEAGEQIARVVTNNLRNSGLFAPVDRDAHIERIENIDLRPRFGDWRVINAQALLIGRVTIDGEDRMQIAFRLWDTATEQQLLGLQFATTPDNWRRIAHKVSDAIYERLTGEQGYFDTRIVYVAESVGQDGETIRRLAVMDQDGANPSLLTDRSFMALLPNYSPGAQQITFVAQREDGRNMSYLYDLATGRRESLFEGGPSLSADGQSLAPRFHPDGRSLVVAAERHGSHHIFRYDLRSRILRQITSHPADDVSPSYAPSGEQIVFSSNRAGRSQLYVMNADGSDVRRITFGDGQYFAPVWSPRGDLVAFVRQQAGGRFSLGVVRPDGSGDERILYEGYFVDSPTWAPNGRVLAFTRGEFAREGTEYSIWSVDLAGFNLRRLPTQGPASDPAWSPLIE